MNTEERGDKGGKGFQQSVKMLKGEEEQETDEEDEQVRMAPNMVGILAHSPRPCWIRRKEQ